MKREGEEAVPSEILGRFLASLAERERAREQPGELTKKLSQTWNSDAHS